MTEQEIANDAAAEGEVQEVQPDAQSLRQRDAYLDPEGGYPDQEVGRQAELAAMTR